MHLLICAECVKWVTIIYWINSYNLYREHSFKFGADLEIHEGAVLFLNSYQAYSKAVIMRAHTIYILQKATGVSQFGLCSAAICSLNSCLLCSQQGHRILSLLWFYWVLRPVRKDVSPYSWGCRDFFKIFWQLPTSNNSLSDSPKSLSWVSMLWKWHSPSHLAEVTAEHRLS